MPKLSLVKKQSLQFVTQFSQAVLAAAVIVGALSIASPAPAEESNVVPPETSQNTSTASPHLPHCGAFHKGDFQAKRAEMEKKFTEKLNLTAAQQKKIHALHEQFYQAHRAEFEAKRAQWQELCTLKEKGAPESEIQAKKEALHHDMGHFKAERKALEAKIKKILTAEQSKKFDDLKAEWHEKHQHHHHKDAVQ